MPARARAGTIAGIPRVDRRSLPSVALMIAKSTLAAATLRPVDAPLPVRDVDARTAVDPWTRAPSADASPPSERPNAPRSSTKPRGRSVEVAASDRRPQGECHRDAQRSNSDEARARRSVRRAPHDRSYLPRRREPAHSWAMIACPVRPVTGPVVPVHPDDGPCARGPCSLPPTPRAAGGTRSTGWRAWTRTTGAWAHPSIRRCSRFATGLPRKPAPVVLEGERVTLRPTDPTADAAPLFAASDGRPMTIGEPVRGRVRPGRPGVALHARWALRRRDGAGRPRCGAGGRRRMRTPAHRHRACDRASLSASSNLMSNDPANLKIELGGIWYGPIVQGTGANTEATWLMLRHVFGLGYRRVEWKCDSLNVRSRRAALRHGLPVRGHPGAAPDHQGSQPRHRLVPHRGRGVAERSMPDSGTSSRAPTDRRSPRRA